MSDVILSSSVRNNLLSIQGTAELLGKTQERLATGLRVGSALDDPNAFFTAASLNQRAGDLSRLQDSIGLAVQTLEAADSGISAITDLVETAQATARQAQQAPAGSTSATTLTGTVAIAADVAAVNTGTGQSFAGTETLASLGFSDGETITVTTGGGTTTHTIGTASSEDVDDVITSLTANTEATVALNGGNVEATAANNTTSITFGGTGDVTQLGLTTTAVNPTNTQVAGFTGTLSVQVNSNTAETIDLSTISNRAGLEAALGALTGVTASVNGSNFVEIVSGDASEALTISGGTEVGVTNGTTASPINAERTALETEFNNLLTQIDQLASDAGFNGSNLLQSDNLSVLFNETGSSSLSISGVDFDSTGLGVSAVSTNGFQTNTSIDATLTQLDSAISTLRTQASTFGSNLSVVEARDSFTSELINTLQTGAANLTLADTNQEGANLLSLQTRQQLSSVSLSLATQGEQNVLRLF